MLDGLLLFRFTTLNYVEISLTLSDIKKQCLGWQMHLWLCRMIKPSSELLISRSQHLIHLSWTVLDNESPPHIMNYMNNILYPILISSYAWSYISSCSSSSLTCCRMVPMLDYISAAFLILLTFCGVVSL